MIFRCFSFVTVISIDREERGKKTNFLTLEKSICITWQIIIKQEKEKENIFNSI